jgi:hypothetical protein
MGVAGWPCSVDKRRGERLHPPVDSYMIVDSYVIDLKAAFGKQLLEVVVGQAIAQAPAHRDRDHLTRESVPAGADDADLDLITRPVSGTGDRPTQQP